MQIVAGIFVLAMLLALTGLVTAAGAVGEPDPDERTSIIRAIDVDTSTLPGTLVEEFTEFFVGDDPRRNVEAGQVYMPNSTIAIDGVADSGRGFAWRAA